jgi:hypothetical protein
MQLMLSLYEFPAEPGVPGGDYPKELVVEHVRCYRLRAAT